MTRLLQGKQMLLHYERNISSKLLSKSTKAPSMRVSTRDSLQNLVRSMPMKIHLPVYDNDSESFQRRADENLRQPYNKSSEGVF